MIRGDFTPSEGVGKTCCSATPAEGVGRDGRSYVEQQPARFIGITSGMELRAYGSGWTESGRPAESTG